MNRKTIRLYLLALICVLCAPRFSQAGDGANAGSVPPPLVEFLPPPPSIDGPDFERDVAIYRETRSEKGGPRWSHAAYAANDKAHLEELFLDSFGLRINKETTPATHELLILVMGHIAKAIDPAKDYYKRVRPFAYFKVFGETCAPADEIWLVNNGSYPSGHSSRGWGLALTLAEISPERQGEILKRGYELGQLRVICGVHWQSDVEAARLAVGAAIVQLHNQPEFIRLLNQAKEEIARLRRL